jgi:hypothetical protein
MVLNKISDFPTLCLDQLRSKPVVKLVTNGKRRISGCLNSLHKLYSGSSFFSCSNTLTSEHLAMCTTDAVDHVGIEIEVVAKCILYNQRIHRY